MKSFDLTPLIKRDYKTFILVPLALVLMVAGITALTGHLEQAYSLVRGAAVGTLDSVILLTGIRRALPYKDEPYKGLAIMKRYRLYRIIAAGSIMVLLLKQGSPIALVFVGFLLIHIFYIFNLIFIAYRLNKEDA